MIILNIFILTILKYRDKGIKGQRKQNRGEQFPSVIFMQEQKDPKNILCDNSINYYKQRFVSGVLCDSPFNHSENTNSRLQVQKTPKILCNSPFTHSKNINSRWFNCRYNLKTPKNLV